MTVQLRWPCLVIVDVQHAIDDAVWGPRDNPGAETRSWPAEDVHALALANMDGEYATVVAAAEVLAALEQLPAGAS